MHWGYYVSLSSHILQKHVGMPYSLKDKKKSWKFKVPASGGIVGIFDVSTKTLAFEAALVIDAQLRTSPRNGALINI